MRQKCTKKLQFSSGVVSFICLYVVNLLFVKLLKIKAPGWVLLVGGLKALLGFSSVVCGAIGLWGEPEVCIMGWCQAQPPKVLNNSPWISFFLCILKSLPLPCLLHLKQFQNILHQTLWSVSLSGLQVSKILEVCIPLLPLEIVEKLPLGFAGIKFSQNRAG